MATGLSSGSCNTSRVIPQNTHASASTRIFLTDTWARPDMVFAHLITTPDTNSPTGAPIVDTSSAGGQATLYYTTLRGMTQDLHTAFANKATTNPNFAGVVPAGDAFQLALDMGVAKSSGFYGPNGTFSTTQNSDLMNLWWDDYLHASKYGSYLDALVQFGTITGLDPALLGAAEIAAHDLGISVEDALTLQKVASIQLGFTAPVPEPSSWALFGAGLALFASARLRGSRAVSGLNTSRSPG